MNDSVQIAKYITEILPAMSIQELLEELKSAARQNRLGSHREEIELIETEIIERVSTDVDIEDEEEEEASLENYADEEILYMYEEQLDSFSNDYLETEEEILNRMKECTLARHGRAWNEYSGIADRDLLSLYEDSIIEEERSDEHREEILRRMRNCMFIGH